MDECMDVRRMVNRWAHDYMVEGMNACMDEWQLEQPHPGDRPDSVQAG